MCSQWMIWWPLLPAGAADTTTFWQHYPESVTFQVRKAHWQYPQSGSLGQQCGIVVLKSFLLVNFSSLALRASHSDTNPFSFHTGPLLTAISAAYVCHHWESTASRVQRMKGKMQSEENRGLAQAAKGGVLFTFCKGQGSICRHSW